MYVTLKSNETARIGDNITITVKQSREGKVTLVVEAPGDTPIIRESTTGLTRQQHTALVEVDL